MDDDLTTPARATAGWRVVDIVVAAVLGVACGLILWLWNGPGYAWYGAMNAVTPGLGGLAQGIWLIGGPLGALIIRKPGAALFVEFVASVISALLGSAWGAETMLYGALQGLGAEIAVLIFAYRRFGPAVAALSGALAGVGCWTADLMMGNVAKGVEFNTVYLIANVISGAILGGILAWLLARALARTGVLSRFASGRG
jgi:energy-coupling factor transport system substrate-specific component